MAAAPQPPKQNTCVEGGRAAIRRGTGKTGSSGRKRKRGRVVVPVVEPVACVMEGKRTAADTVAAARDAWRGMRRYADTASFFAAISIAARRASTSCVVCSLSLINASTVSIVGVG
jgi:hypothetical protein